MVARRAQILVGAAITLSVLATAWAVPVAGAVTCTLSAPTYVNVGTPLSISGSGFPASSAVDVTFSIDGKESDAFTVQSDASGGLQIALTPEAIDIGVTTVDATAGSSCTAQVVYTVLPLGATPPPTTEPEPSSGTGAEAAAPPTDMAPPGSSEPAESPDPWFLGFGLLAAGGIGLLLTRRAERR